MYQGKRLQKKASSGLRWQGKNAAMLIPALALLLTLSVGGTVAFLVAKGNPVRNEFTPSAVSCQVVEGTFNGDTKADVAVQNTGDTEAYIRAAIVVTWKAAEGGNIYAVKPKENVDYTITLNDTDWVLGSDGFYYHKKPVAAGKETQVLIETCSPVGGKVPAGYGLNVEIIGSAIQSVPDSVVTSVWSSGVRGVTADGTLSFGQ